MKMRLPILLALLLCGIWTAQAQRGNYNFNNFENKDFYFGVALGLHQSNFVVHRSSEFAINEEIKGIESLRTPGINIGIITNLKAKKYFDLRFTPSLVLGGKHLGFAGPNTGNTLQSQSFETVAVELPFHLRYKSAPYKDKRLFVIAGMKYSFDMVNELNTLGSDDLVKISPTDFALEIGAGIQFFFPYFIFSPEIKWSQGIGNVHIYNHNLGASTVLEKVLSRALTISLNFEG